MPAKEKSHFRLYVLSRLEAILPVDDIGCSRYKKDGCLKVSQHQQQECLVIIARDSLLLFIHSRRLSKQPI
jgi:hypothetical protein